uniref:SDR family NAD(P)-dependent oxidoreductase n=1 Tax=Paractinoplanes polyasparticus TaxID=2856853 RepID=UPI001C866409|nr:SDR family NAD(P)-dependent oxidoreductase [Actinoplanes polyasparticus]
MSAGRRVLIPGGTGGVGEGVVRACLAAGAQVVVPTRSERRAAEFRRILGAAASDRLQVVVHDYTTLEGAERLVAGLGEPLDDVVAPIGGYWGGRPLQAIDAADRQRVFALVLGPVRTRSAGDAPPGWISADLIGEVAVAVSASAEPGREIRLPDSAAAAKVLDLLRGRG